MKARQKKDPDFTIPDLDYERIFDPSEFDMKENFIFLKEEPENPLLRVKLEAILRAAHYREQGTMIVSEAFYDPCNQMIDAKTCMGNVSAAYIFGTQGAEEDTLEKVYRSPDTVVSQSQGGNAVAGQDLGDLDELVKGSGSLETQFIEDPLVVPQDVGPVDIHRYAVDFTTGGNDIDDPFRI